MVLGPLDVFVRLVNQRPFYCDTCGVLDEYAVPAAVDWRDHDAIARLVVCFPTVTCSGCGAPITPDVPVVVLRPGDPVGWMLGVPAQWLAHNDPASVGELLARVRGVAAGLPDQPPPRLDHATLVAVTGRYSGFDLARIGLDGAPTAPPPADEFAAVRDQTTVPAATDQLLELLGAEDEPAVLRVVELHPALRDPTWGPVFRAIGRRLVSMLDSPEAVRLARYRLIEVNRLRWRSDPVPPGEWEALDEAGRAVLSQAHQFGALNGRDRRVVLGQLLELVEQQPEHRAFLAEELLTYFVRLYESPDRVPDDLEVAVPAGLHAVRWVQEVFGPQHPMTLLAVNDLGSALLDRQQGDPDAAREQAIELYTAAVRAAAAAAEPVLADLVHNLGAAYAHRQRESRSANQRAAEQCFAWSLHLAPVLAPERLRSAIQSRIALASVLRERRTGDRLRATTQALAMFRQILDDPAQAGLLEAPERLVVESNVVSAMYQLSRLDAGAVDTAEVIRAAEAVAASAQADPVRAAATLSNVGSVLGSLYHDNGFVQPELLARAVGLTGRAYEAARAGHTPDHPEVLRIGLNHAAMLGMPVRRDIDPAPTGGSPAIGGLAGGVATVGYYDGDAAVALLATLVHDCPPDRLPAHAAVIANNLGRHQFSVGNYAEACGAFRAAMTGMDRLYRAGADPEAQLAELGVPGEPMSWSSVSGWLVVAALREGGAAGAARAVAAIEESRGKLLADRLRTGTPAPDPGHAESDGPVLYVGTSAVGSWVILIPPRGRSHLLVSGLYASDLRPAVQRLRGATNPTERAEALATIAELAREPVTGPAFELLAERGITDIGVVASGQLSGLPLHALPAARDGGCWLDRAAVRYLPSAAIVRHIESRPPSGRTDAVAVASPDLALARHEAALLERTMRSVLTPPAAGDRRLWLLSVLPRVAHLLLSCHARWLDHDPLRSPIELDVGHALRMEDLIAAQDAPDLVVASCCVTGVTTEALADEILGFGTGMLLAGARAAVVSNWELGDRVSALTLAAFYQESARGAEPAAALRSAQLWLRDLTVADLLALGTGRPAGGRDLDLPDGLRHELAALRFTPLAADPSIRPYADAAGWAGFSCYGARIHPGGTGDGAT